MIMGSPTVCADAGTVHKAMEFIACPEFLKFFNINPETVDNILKSDFNCGFISAVSIILFIFLLVLAIRILAFIFFRSRRCNKIMVQSGGGTLIVTRKAIESVIRAELAAFSQISVRKLVLYRKGKLWWHDLRFLMDCVHDTGAKPWIWSDSLFEHTEEFLANVDPDEVLYLQLQDGAADVLIRMDAFIPNPIAVKGEEAEIEKVEKWLCRKVR